MNTTWQNNDGIVNSVSSIAPSLNSTDIKVQLTVSIEPGVWNHIDRLPMDHINCIGFSWGSRDYIFQSHMKIIIAIEATHSNTTRRLTTHKGQSILNEVKRNHAKALDEQLASKEYAANVCVANATLTESQQLFRRSHDVPKTPTHAIRPSSNILLVLGGLVGLFFITRRQLHNQIPLSWAR